MRAGVGTANLLLLALGAGGIGSATLGGAPAEPPVDFSRDVLPILSDRCFKCHGPDEGSRQAGLRLDTSDGAFASRGEGRWAIVPGKPEQSLLVQRIGHPNSPMPPRSSGKSLSADEIRLLTRWIAEGAKYGRLWSFELLPAEVEVPKVKSSWPRTDLDRFILDRLNRVGLKPSPEAPRWRWLRRVTFDLTGLPPTEEEIAAFENDRSKEAYERVVDRLLASPHFGERMAVEWLDAARYGDSYGYQSDLLMPAWPYRDWVVRAFNANKPYDEFLVEQLAGDLLPNPTRDQRLATAFNRLHRQSNEGGSIPLEWKTEYAADRVDTFGTAVLGLTLGCARCHDHKFDPIKQREYYGLFAYFNSIQEFGLYLSTEIVPTPSLLLPTKEQEAKLDELRAKSDEARLKLKEALEGKNSNARIGPDHGVVARFSLDEESGGAFANQAGAAKAEKIGSPRLVDGYKGKALLLDGDNGLVVRGLPARERWDAFTWTFWMADPRKPGPAVLLHRSGGTDVGFCGFDLILEDGYLTARVMRHWPGNAIAVRTKSQAPRDAWTHVAWTWNGGGTAAGLKLYLNGLAAETEVLSDRLWKKINAYGDLGPSGGDWSFGQRFRDAGFKGGKIDEIAYTSRDLTGWEVRQIFDPRAQPMGAEIREIRQSTDPGAAGAKEELRRAQRELAIFEDSIQEISVMEETPSIIPAFLLRRGEYDAPRTEATRVDRGAPASLPPLRPQGANDRLALARWTTDRDHPLTSRVIVNRLWQLLFGTGLVETSENFGVQGSRPSHPELLDYLARRFVDSGWDVKAMLKEMVLSSTYRQDSSLRPELKRKDPENRLHARGPSRRLPAEMVRDAALAASGLLDRTLGGPPVNAYQPANIWQEFNTMSPGFVQSTGVGLYRRSLYSTWKRTTPVPNMMLFDATSRESCVVRRPATNTPLQALVLLNDVQFVEAARALAELVLKGPGDDDPRLIRLFLRLAGRKPLAEELKVLRAVLEEQRAAFRKDVLAAGRLIEVGDSKPDAKLRPSELAAWTVVAQTVLNLDAAVWKR